MTAKEFSDVLGCRFKNQVDDYDGRQVAAKAWKGESQVEDETCVG